MYIIERENFSLIESIVCSQNKIYKIILFSSIIMKMKKKKEKFSRLGKYLKKLFFSSLLLNDDDEKNFIKNSPY